MFDAWREKRLLEIYTVHFIFFLVLEDWKTRLTTADGSNLELDPDLLEDAKDDVDFQRTR